MEAGRRQQSKTAPAAATGWLTIMLLVALVGFSGPIGQVASAHPGESCGNPEEVQARRTVTGVLSEENPSDWYVKASGSGGYLLVQEAAGAYTTNSGRSAMITVWNADCSETLCDTESTLTGGRLFIKGCVFEDHVTDPWADTGDHVIEVRLIGQHPADETAYTLQVLVG